ncbi:PucR family transcriptional regulator [Longivirga aurantiaca]|uniref:PucR family transcriptional regulator n=1 Tax=Longivirga aurantiaca TaxID=1837743 RepID=A0ABW1T2J3_9ACTN
MPTASERHRATTVRRLERATGSLATAASARMESELPWYAAMSAEDRSWVNLVAQAGIAAFVRWFRDPEGASAITADVFGTAPQELVRAVSLQQTVDLVRTTIAVVEEHVQELASPEDLPWVREGMLLYSREIAFAAAQVYARAAEARGAWDARLESLVLDALLRDDLADDVVSRGAALGWGAVTGVCVVTGHAPDGDPETVAEGVKRAARHHRYDALTGVQSQRLVVVLGNVTDAATAARAVLAHFAPGPVVVGPVVPRLADAGRSAKESLTALRAAVAWPDAPRPVLAEDLLPERALDGDDDAVARLVTEVYDRLLAEDPALVETLSAYLERTGSLEGTARELFVHPNTVRYRLRRVADVTGLTPTMPRDAWSLRMALALGRLGEDRTST